MIFSTLYFSLTHLNNRFPYRSVLSKQTMRMHQTTFIIAVRHVLSPREFSEIHCTHLLLQFKNLNSFAYVLPIRATVRRSLSI
jgi:hypothetical protein